MSSGKNNNLIFAIIGFVVVVVGVIVVFGLMKGDTPTDRSTSDSRNRCRPPHTGGSAIGPLRGSYSRLSRPGNMTARPWAGMGPTGRMSGGGSRMSRRLAGRYK